MNRETKTVEAVRDENLEKKLSENYKYKTIYADPPWAFNDKLDDSRKKPYDTLTINDLKKLDINSISAEKSHCYLWCPSSFLKHGIKVIESWGFDYKTHIVWLKKTKHNKIWFGVGHYFRSCNEICLFGAKANLRCKTKNTRNFLEAKKPKTHHSSKPDEMYSLINKNSYDPKEELFATHKVSGWDSIGYEINKKDIRNII